MAELMLGLLVLAIAGLVASGLLLRRELAIYRAADEGMDWLYPPVVDPSSEGGGKLRREKETSIA